MLTPPPEHTLPIIEKIRLLHADIYSIGNRLPKQHKLGIHQLTEQLVLKVMEFVIEGAFKSKQDKSNILASARVKNEVLKYIIRTEHEQKIITEKEYLKFSEQIIEISKMLNGWITYITEKSQGQ